MWSLITLQTIAHSPSINNVSVLYLRHLLRMNCAYWDKQYIDIVTLGMHNRRNVANSTCLTDLFYRLS